jgi:Zn-dependent peptidase ImmA (M78 family)
MDYEELYRNLAFKLFRLGCKIWDSDYYGFCDRPTKKIKAYIFVNPRLSYQQRFFILAHEAGHLFTLKKDGIFEWSRKVRSEKEANWFAIQLINRAKIDVTEYYAYYEKAKKSNKFKGKPWYAP